MLFTIFVYKCIVSAGYINSSFLFCNRIFICDACLLLLFMLKIDVKNLELSVSIVFFIKSFVILCMFLT